MNVRTIGYLSHIIFFRTFSIDRLTYGIICRYSEVIRVCFIIAYLGRSVSRNDQRARADRIKLGCSTATCQRAGAKVYGRLSELHFIWFTDDIFVSLANINDGFFSCHSNCCQWCLTCPKRSLSYSETAHRAHATPFDFWRKQPRHSFPRFPLIFGHCTVGLGLPTSASGLQEDRYPMGHCPVAGPPLACTQRRRTEAASARYEADSTIDRLCRRLKVCVQPQVDISK